MKHLKAAAIFASLIGGPFITVGLTVFYRRALAWWYENPIAMDRESAQMASWLVIACVGFVVTMLTAFRLIEGRWVWDKSE